MKLLGQEQSEKLLERHYSVAELAQQWNLSRDTIRRIFENGPGVVCFQTAKAKQTHLSYASNSGKRGKAEVPDRIGTESLMIRSLCRSLETSPTSFLANPRSSSHGVPIALGGL